MLTLISREITDNIYTGVQHPPADKTVGGEFPYLKGVSAGRYKPQSNKKCSMKTLSLSVRTGLIGEASRNAEISGSLNIGKWSAYIDSTQLTEYRNQWSSLPNVTGADECVVQNYNAFQLPSMGHGIVVPSGSTFTIKCTPEQATNVVWYVTVFGKSGSTVDIQETIKLTATTTADQILLTYTPTSDWTILSIIVNIDVPGQLAGQAVINYNGFQILETPYIGLGESSSNMFDDKGFVGYGCGALNIPLWNIEFNQNDFIEFIPIPHCSDFSKWGLTIAGVESDVETGNSGATCFAF